MNTIINFALLLTGSSLICILFASLYDYVEKQINHFNTSFKAKYFYYGSNNIFYLLRRKKRLKKIGVQTQIILSKQAVNINNNNLFCLVA